MICTPKVSDFRGAYPFREKRIGEAEYPTRNALPDPIKEHMY